MTTERQPETIAVLWQGMSGYFNACLKALAARGVGVVLAYGEPTAEAPFEDEQFEWLRQSSYRWSGHPSTRRVRALIADAEPSAVLVSSWHIGGYRRALRALDPQHVTRVLCMDNQWHGTPRQWLGRLTWRLYIRPIYDLAFVPGDRQAQFARLLGFDAAHIMRGLYAADTAKFAPSCSAPARASEFLYVGRLVRDKGIRTLACAYVKYRSTVTDPWGLVVVGTGPDSMQLQGIPGVRRLGFIQPEELPTVMHRSRALVCPSLYEPWGVVIHEAAAAGLILICSEATGASVHLVQDGYNGHIVKAGDVEALAWALAAVSRASQSRLVEMSAASLRMSQQLSPERWAAYVLEMLSRHRERRK